MVLILFCVHVKSDVPQQAQKVINETVQHFPFLRDIMDAYQFRLSVNVYHDRFIHDFATLLHDYNPSHSIHSYCEMLSGAVLSNPFFIRSPQCPSFDQNEGLQYRVNDQNANCRYPSCDISLDEFIIVVWQDERHGMDNPDIYGQYYDLQLDRIGDNFQIHVNSDSAAQTHPMVATLTSD